MWVELKYDVENNIQGHLNEVCERKFEKKQDCKLVFKFSEL
jgi:hypothetical protein